MGQFPLGGRFDRKSCGGINGCEDPPCPVTCPPDSNQEDEPCGSDTNGGCNSVPPAFTDAACGQTWCGTGWATGGTRDTDWYLVNHGGGVISGTVVSEFPAVCFIVDGIGACAPVVVGDIGCSDACANIAVASADLPAGQYVVFVAAGDCGGGGVFEGFPCGDCNQYSVSIECVGAVTGACCLPDDSCVDGVTQAECEAPAGGCGNCNQASGVPGCSDPVCQAIVCGIDPFCCDVAWDSICAGEADDLCNCGGGLGGEYQGDDTSCADVQCGVPTGACCQCDGSEQFCTIETDADCAALGGLFLGDDTSCEAAGEQLTVSSGAVNVPIPDNNATGASHTIMVAPSFTVVDVNVQLTITHTWVGDLCVTLTHGATTTELIRRPGLSPDTCGPGSCCGCSADNYSGLVLDDEGAGGPIESAPCVNNLTSPPAYTPNQSLDAYDGDDSAGAWTLSVYDGAGADIGNIVNWSIILTQPATGTPCQAAYPDQCQPSVARTLIIKQGACPAPVNPGSNGLTLMLLVGDADFDVSSVDTSTLALSRCDGVGGSVGPATITFKDLNHPNPAPATCATGGCTCNADQSSDGIDDLELKFDTADMASALELDDLAVDEIVTLVLSGELTDGTAFTASDCIRIVGGGDNVIAVTSNLPEIWVDATPADVNFDDGGFTSFSRAYPDLTEVSFTAPKVPASHPTWVLSSVWINGVNFSANDGNFLVVASAATQWVFLEYRQRSIGPVPGGPAVIPPGAGNAE